MRHAHDSLAASLLITSGTPANQIGDVAIGYVDIPPGDALAIAVDALVEGVHFATSTGAEDVAFKAVAVNLSDLAAMGATPRAAAVGLAVEASRSAWLEGFRNGLGQAADAFGIDIVAADVCRGATVVSVEALGHVPVTDALYRKGALPGDSIFVTGSLGDAGLALALGLGRGEVSLSDDDDAYLLARLNRPQPRLAAGVALRGIASAAIDLSDGLSGDLGHVLSRSGVGASVEVDKLPLSAALRNGVCDTTARRLAISAGDDYELCFTVPESRRRALEARRHAMGCPVTHIGRIEAEPGLRFKLGDGRPYETPPAYTHFSV
jgi:thiamine-monophosphate kinase